ncbi:MAG TPA: hypothetical protein VNE39_08925 [Planctomycetota bacterium]|nr:hypothetical protein [Planctomycetota bacterium]
MIGQRLFAVYYFIKYLPLRLWRHGGPMEHRGFVGVQIDGLAHADLTYAVEHGYLLRLRRRLRNREYKLHAFPAGLPSATSYAQVGMFYGENADIPAFRWYERADRRVVNCNRPHSAEYIRPRLGDRMGILRGGSSYVNLVDGDADRAVLTANSSVPRSFFEEIGGFRLFLLALLHPLRMGMTLLASVRELFYELYDRCLSRTGRHSSVVEGWFPVLRVLSNVIFREVQTIAVMADVYAGVPYIFTTFTSYDELAHHYGPRSRPALKNLRGIVGRILEIEKITRRLPGRHYDLIVVSDHGQTEGNPFLRLFGATLGQVLHRHFEGRRVHVETDRPDLPSTQTRGLYADHLARRAEGRSFLTRGILRGIARLLRKITNPESYLVEKYYVDPDNDFVVTYSGTLAHVYFSRWPERLDDAAVRREFPDVLEFLVGHPGVGLVATRAAEGGLVLRSRRGIGRLVDGEVTAIEGDDPLAPYDDAGPVGRRALERMGGFANAGDLILFGTYDERGFVCFDDQVASHGALGGPQFWPFLLVPNDPRFDRLAITDPRDLYAQVFLPYHHGPAEGGGL